MNLKDHKQLVREYEDLLSELRALRRVRPEDEWSASVMGDCQIPLPSDYAQKLLREHLWGVEKRAKDAADALGVTFEE